jgi:protein tyrosine phosphatase (PTP) superfamily phosphohydrolase (DUF442 family)
MSRATGEEERQQQNDKGKEALKKALLKLAHIRVGFKNQITRHSVSTNGEFLHSFSERIKRLS